MSGSLTNPAEASTRWASQCPQCEYLEERGHGPGRYPSAPRCPECNWPMNCVDPEVLAE